MTLLKDPVVSSGDDLDNLLRAFFQAEMPNPWPVVEVPARPVLVVADREERPARSSRGSLVHSRLALAASVALLVSGPLFLHNALQDTGPKNSSPPSIGDSADRRFNPPRPREGVSLELTPDGVSIRVDISEEPAKK